MQESTAIHAGGFQEPLTHIGLKRVFITHTGCDMDAEYLKNELK
ncbi:MAG: hypothetical protein AB2L18_02375 [Anaerolineaceae bacterium]